MDRVHFNLRSLESNHDAAIARAVALNRRMLALLDVWTAEDDCRATIAPPPSTGVR